MTNNELIAEFYCEKARPVTSSIFTGKEYLFNGWFYKEFELPFDTCWDWFMPAYRKFKDVLIEHHKQLPPHSACHGDLFEVDIATAVMEVDLTKANFYLVQGIKWYNENKTK